MPSYHIIMVIVFFLSIFVVYAYSFIKGKNYTVCSLVGINPSKQRLTDSDFQHIQTICNGWFKTSKLWGSMHYALAVNSAVASIITVYIASSGSTANVNADIILYSIIALIFSMTSLILRCDAKSKSDRDAFIKMQSKIYDYKLEKCTQEEVVECFVECDIEVAKFLF